MIKQKLFLGQIDALLDNNNHMISIFSNLSACIYMNYADLNWAGFYFTDENSNLYLGPFQGKVACTDIPYNKGVCGSAVARDKVLRIDNVHEFEGHIACDSASNSEIVIPIHCHGKIIGVLDIDSPEFSRFNDEDENTLIIAMKKLEEFLEKNNPLCSK